MNKPEISTTTLPASLADRELAALTLSGHREAFETIMRRNNQRLFRLARSIVNNDSDAEDILQESYIRAYTRLASFRGEASLSTWLGRIVVNEALGRLRQTRARPVFEPLDTVVEDNTVVPFARLPNGPERNALNADLRQQLETEIDRLPEVFRTVFMLREVEQLSIQETAQLLDIPPATVKTRCFRARQVLREALSEQIETQGREAFVFLGSRCDRMVSRVMQRLTDSKLLY